MSVPSKPQWRWKLLSSSGSPLCLIIPQTIEETLSWCLSCGKTSNELPKRFALQPIFFCGGTEQCQSVDEIQKNTLKQSLWQFIPLKPKVMFPFVSKKDYQLWHLSRNSHRTACLFASRAWKGLTFKERRALIWQFQTCFNAKKKKKTKSRTVWGCVRFVSSPHTSWKGLNMCFVHDAESRLLQFITKLRFQAGLFSTVQVSEHSDLSTSTFTQGWWFRNILTHPCHPCHYLSRFYSSDGFELVPRLNGLHAEQPDELKFALEMLSKLPLIISMATLMILEPEEEGKKSTDRGKEKHTGQTWVHVAGNLRWNFYFAGKKRDQHDQPWFAWE